MVGMTYWRKGGEEPPRRADEIGGEGVARRICRGCGLACLKSRFSTEKIFYDLRLDLRFVW